MAKTETLQDDFNDNSLDTNKWINYGGDQVVETNQELEITTTTLPNLRITLDNIYSTG